MRPVGVGLVGFGTIGTGVAKLLLDHAVQLRVRSLLARELLREALRGGDRVPDVVHDPRRELTERRELLGVREGALHRDRARQDVGRVEQHGELVGEYLDGLPYRSKALNMTQDLWLSLSVAEQQDFIDELETLS